MKEIKAFIKPHKLAAVTQALHHLPGLSGMTVTDARGFGRGKAKDVRHRIVDDLVDFAPCVRVEILCRDALADEVVRVIREAAHTGLKGDGKIFVSSVEYGLRISTGETGDAAV